MKKLIPLILGAAMIAPVYAGGLDLQNRILLNRSKMLKDGVIKAAQVNTPDGFIPTRSSSSGNENVPGSYGEYVNAFIKIADGYSSSDLEAAGMKIHSVKGKVAIVAMPTDSVESFSSLECVKKLTLEKQLSTRMNLARKDAGVDEIHSGAINNMPYTGEGVVAAIVDQGVDPHHISFLDTEGKNRIKFLSFYDGVTADSNGLPAAKFYGDGIVYEDEKGNIRQYPELNQFVTDTKSSYHGTHTLNILGGSYKGDLTVYEDGGLKTVANPYYGVAPDANLAVSCGSLSDACVAMGIYDMLDYAAYNLEETGAPSVLSISLGSTMGPHDPNSLMNLYLTECGNETIIVISAGNEGDLKIALKKDLTAEDSKVQTMIYPYDDSVRYDPSVEAGQYNTYIRQGAVMVMSNDETPFKLQAFIMEGTPGNYRRRATLDLTSEEGNYYLSDIYYEDYVGGLVNTTVKKYFDGYIGGGAMLDEDLGRYYGIFDYYLFTNPETGINADGSEGVIVGFEVIGQDGQRIECYGDGDNTWMYNYGMEGYDDGSRDGTISDMAIGENILVAGAYNTRYDWTALDGVSYSYADIEGFELGAVGPYSSYGTLSDGRTLPHVCAPGSAIMSAYSGPYIDNVFSGHEDYIPKNTTAKATVNGKDYYWKPETGTSMSTPFIAGSIALWLEADPSLTINDIYDIIEKTSVKDDFVNSGISAQWGAGKFNALEGLKMVINNAGVESLTVDDRNDRLILSEVSPGIFNVFVGTAKNLNVDVYSIAGAKVQTVSNPGNEATIDLTSLAKGVYVVKANNHASKIYIR